MKEKMTQQDYENLKNLVLFHSHKYYVEHQPLISDQEFDVLYKKLEEVEVQHPEWITATSPTQRIAEGLTKGFSSFLHTIPMLSLANTYNKEEIAEFLKRMNKLVEQREMKFCCELKMDGIAISALYHKGVFVRGGTRGDGRKGDDITANMRTIQALPLRIAGEDIPEILEVRGEVFIKHSIFKALNEERIQTNEPLWANPRNAAAGSLKLLDPKLVAKRQLSIAFYSIAENSSSLPSSQFEAHHLLKKWGFPTLQKYAICSSLEEIWNTAEEIRQLRKNLDYDIDGMVIKLDSLSDQRHLGVTGKNPRWAVAYKFAAEQATTRILAITVQVGRTGTLTPVAELEPVSLAGSTISRATLHNEDEIIRKGIRVGDIVTIEKGGDIIPKVVEVKIELRQESSQPWKMPDKCPSCFMPVHRVEGEVAMRCNNSEHCPEQQLRRIIYFAGKDAMDIEHLGEKNVEQLMKKGFVRQPSDIYSLTEDQLYQLDNFKAKSVENLLKSIDASRDVSLDRFIMALGIKHVGSGTAELLSERAGNIETLCKMSAEDLMQIHGVGDKVANSVYLYLNDEKNRQEIARLLARGVRPHSKMAISYEGHVFTGRTFVLTGTLQKFSRSEAASLIKERGGKITESISKKTDYLLLGESPGSKLEKAKNLAIKMMTEQEFQDSL